MSTTLSTSPSAPTRSAQIVRSEERQRWRDTTVDSHQSFPATGSFDLIGNSFGMLMMHNDDVVSPGEGFDMHQHDNAEIVSWIMDGAVRHRDSHGTDTIVKAGNAQTISAGSGIRHSELNAAGFTSREKLRVVQMWLPPDQEDAQPRHAEANFQEAVDHSRATGEFFTVAVGDMDDGNSHPDSPLHVGTRGTELKIAYLSPGAATTLPESRYVHLYAAEGPVTMEDHTGDRWTLQSGDVLRLVNPEIAVNNDPASPDLRIVTDPANSAEAVLIAWRMSRAAVDYR